MSSPHITYVPRRDATPEGELNVLANVYRFILDCHVKKMAAEPGSCNDAAIVRNTEGVSHVEQRPDRPLEIVVTHSRKGSNVWSISEAIGGEGDTQSDRRLGTSKEVKPGTS